MAHRICLSPRWLVASALMALVPVCVAQVGGEKVFHGYLLATADVRIVTKAERTIPADATKVAFDKAFPAERFRVLPWGEDRLLVIDLSNGPLGRLRDEALVTQTFLNKRETDGTIEVSRLTPEENRAAQEALGGSWMSTPGRPPQPPEFLGMDRFVRVELQMGGRSKTVHLPMSAVSPDASFASLRKRFNPQGASMPVPEDPSRRDETLLFYAGSARKAAIEGTLAYAKSIESLQKELIAKNSAVASSLLGRLGVKQTKDADRTQTLSEMPDELRNALQNVLSNSWQVSGFSSREEAMAFLANSDGYRTWTDLCIVQMLDPGDPDKHRPGATGGGRFTSVPGYYP